MIDSLAIIPFTASLLIWPLIINEFVTSCVFYPKFVNHSVLYSNVTTLRDKIEKIFHFLAADFGDTDPCVQWKNGQKALNSLLKEVPH
jgi:hypothetical protein